MALVLALTLTAGCAVSWGERAQKNDDPFADKSYTVDTLLYEAPGFTDGFTDGAYPTFRTATNPAGEKYVTMFNDLGYALIYGPMEEYKLEKQSFYALFGNTRDASPVDDLMQHNKSAWTGYCEEAKDSQPYQAYLLEQEDGTIYLGLSADYAEDGSECFCMVYRLNEQINPIYASMDDYAAMCVEDLKKGTMTYSVSENNEYASRSIEDTVADVRVTRLEQGDSLGNLSPDGTVLELWYFQYEMKPTNEAGAQINIVGGQELTDDGYLNEHWTHYLTVLHYTYGEKTGYQIIGTYTGNDGLWYNGCSYSGEEKYYLHDFYVDYAGLDLPKMYIPDLVDGLVEDGYGHGNSVEGRLISGNGNYSFYAPISGWTYKPDAEYAEYWYSSYNTGSYFSVTEVDHSLYDEKPEWESAGYTAEWIDESCRFVTHEGMSNTVVTLFNGPNNTCYIVEIHWLFDGSTEENQWGWNHDRAVEEEAVILQAMVNSFRTSKILPTTAPVLDDPAFKADLQLATNGGASWMYLSKNSAAVSDCNMRNVTPTVKLDECSYALLNEEFTPDDGKQTLTLWLSNNDSSHLAFYEGTNVMLYQRDDARYYKVSNFGDYATLYDAMLAWFNSAQSGTEPSDASSTTTTNAVSRDSLIKAADSYVDLGGYLWYTAGGKFCRWREGGSVETVCDLPLDYDTPVSASLSTQDNRILMNYHIGGATMGSFITDLYDTDGKKLSSINGYNAIAISGDIIVMTDHFMPTPNNMSISYDCGKTFTEFGDKDWFYGSALTEDGTYVTSVNSSLEIRDGYVYTTAVYDINHEKSNAPLVTHAVRISIKTGAQEILD